MGVGLIELGRVADDLLLNQAAFVDVFILDIKHGVNRVFAGQRAEAVLESPAGEDGAVAAASLAGAGQADGVEKSQFKIAGLFQVVIVGDEVGLGLGTGGGRRYHRCSERESRDEQTTHADNSPPK